MPSQPWLISFAAVRLQLDGTGFEAQATALATKSGQNAGTVMSQNISSKLKSAAAGAIGAFAGFAAGAALTGATQLDAAMRQLQADTGMTADAAKLAEHSIAGMFQNNLQGMDQIGATMAVVINGLDLTGAAADAMTQKFLTFETATGQDSAAVSAFHEILNAWNLDASAAPHIMDLLVASHQKYGSVVTDNQSALQKLAPQMIALGMTIDDTMGLLNLFDSAGMDASKAMFALNTAVKNLKPGQTLNDLIVQVSSIEDPTLRAQEAIKLFGARGGVNLANALKPGITSLDQFKTSVEQNTAATDRGAAAIESAFGNQATLKLHEFQGALAELGTNMGDLVIVAALLGPGLTKGLLAGLGGLTGLLGPRIWAGIIGAAPEAVVAGEAVGLATGEAVGTGTAVGLAGSLRALLPKVLAGLFGGGASIAGLDETQVWKDAGEAYAKSFGKGSTPTMAADGKAAGLAATDGLAYGLVAGTPAVMNTVTTVTGGITRGMQTGIMQGMAALGNLGTVAVADLVKTFGTGMAGVLAAAHNLGHATGVEGMTAMAQGIVAAEQAPLDAFTTMMALMKSELTPAAEAARLAGELTSDSLAKGLTDKRPAVRAQAIATKEAILDRLVVLAEQSGPIGAKAMAELAKGMKDKDPEIRAMAKSAHDAVIAELDKTVPDAGLAGGAAGHSYAVNFLGKLKDDLVLPSLPGSTSNSSQRSGLPGVPLATGMPYVAQDMLAVIHQSEAVLTVPQADAWRAGAGGAGQTINIANVNLGDQHDEFSLLQSLRFLAQVTA